jgi:hypothetical protein
MYAEKISEKNILKTTKTQSFLLLIPVFQNTPLPLSRGEN